MQGIICAIHQKEPKIPPRFSRSNQKSGQKFTSQGADLGGGGPGEADALARGERLGVARHGDGGVPRHEDDEPGEAADLARRCDLAQYLERRGLSEAGEREASLAIGGAEGVVAADALERVLHGGREGIGGGNWRTGRERRRRRRGISSHGGYDWGREESKDFGINGGTRV